MKKHILPTIAAINFALLVFVAVSGDLADANWLTLLVSQLPVFPFLVPTVVIALGCLPFRQIWMAGFHIAGFMVAFMVLVPFGMPRMNNPFAASASSKGIRVMTFNVDHGLQGAPAILATL